MPTHGGLSGEGEWSLIRISLIHHRCRFSPLQLSVRGSIKSASSDEFHTDSSLFRDYGEGLDDRDDRTEAKVLIDRQMAEKRPALAGMGGRYMKDYGPEQDEDWGQGEAMAEGEWKDVVGSVVIGTARVARVLRSRKKTTSNGVLCVSDEEVSLSCEVKELQTSVSCKGVANGNNLAELVAASAEHGLIEDESAPEDSLFSSSPASTSEDSPSKHSAHSGDKGPGRRRVRTKKREGKDKDASRRSQRSQERSAKDTGKEVCKPDEKKEVGRSSRLVLSRENCPRNPVLSYVYCLDMSKITEIL